MSLRPIAWIRKYVPASDRWRWQLSGLPVLLRVGVWLLPAALLMRLRPWRRPNPWRSGIRTLSRSQRQWFGLKRSCSRRPIYRQQLGAVGVPRQLLLLIREGMRAVAQLFRGHISRFR